MPTARASSAEIAEDDMDSPQDNGDSNGKKLGTKARILEVAERLFAKEGFDTVSLRHITEDAGVNLAAVNYHFGSKDALVFAVLENRILPLNVERVRILKETSEALKGKPLPVEQIARSFIHPVILAVEESSHEDAILSRLIARFMGEQSDRMQKMVVEQFPELAQTFVIELCKSIPHLSPMEALFRLLYADGSLTHALLYYHRLHLLVEDGFETPSIEEVEEMLVPFIIEGFKAPLAPTDSSPE